MQNLNESKVMLWFLCKTISHNPWPAGSEMFVLDCIESLCANRNHEKEPITVPGEKKLTTINDGDAIFSLIACCCYSVVTFIIAVAQGHTDDFP